MLAIFVFGGVFALSAAGLVWKGYVLTLLWAWFIVPTFHLAPIAMAPAIGIALVSSYLTYQYLPKLAKEGTALEQLGHSVGSMVLTPAFALLIGWIVKQWL